MQSKKPDVVPLYRLIVGMKGSKKVTKPLFGSSVYNPSNEPPAFSLIYNGSLHTIPLTSRIGEGVPPCHPVPAPTCLVTIPDNEKLSSPVCDK